MEVLSIRDRKIVVAHSKDDLTFKDIANEFGISESQVSRVYKKAIQKIKREIHKK